MAYDNKGIKRRMETNFNKGLWNYTDIFGKEGYKDIACDW